MLLRGRQLALLAVAEHSGIPKRSNSWGGTHTHALAGRRTTETTVTFMMS